MAAGRKPKPGTLAPAWAKRLREARDDRGLSQDGLGREIGKNQRTIAGYETGKAEPDFATISLIAEKLGVSVAWLAFGVGQKTDGDALAQSVIETQQQDRLFARTFTNAARVLAEVGLDADLAFTIALTQKLLRAGERAADTGETWEAVERALEVERAELAAGLDELRKKRL